MKDKNRLDRVSIFGDKLSFLIPHEWVETDEDDDYLYHHPDADSGWLRVSLITVRVEGETPDKKLEKFFEGRHNVTREPRTGNLVHSFEKDSEEDGVPIHLHYWMVANVVPPDLVREAVFSYTVLSNMKNEEETREIIGLLEKLVSWADFCPRI